MVAPVSELELQSLVSFGQLPALPQSAIRILEVSQNPDHGPIEFAVPIEADPGLASQVLRFVNSSYFGFSREISSIKNALMLVGVRTIKNFTLWSAVFSLLPNPRCGSFDLRSLWQDSLRRALFARNVGSLLGIKLADEIFAAALLQDMAIPLLAKGYPDVYLEMFGDRQQGEQRLSDLERQRFGWTHADIGAQLARHWSLPDDLATLIENHLTLEPPLAGDYRSVGQVAVSLSALLPVTADNAWSECSQFITAFTQLVSTDGQRLNETLAQVDHDFQDFAPLLKISSPGKSLTEHFLEAAASG